MRQCHFCQRWFKNQQAVKAHLRFCKEYQKHLELRESALSDIDDNRWYKHPGDEELLDLI